MIKNEVFFDVLKNNKVDFFCGVPDSLLKNFCAYLSDNSTANQHIITANEGSAIALASGYHLATGKLPLVYLQNSGLGNTVNPILSLADKEVYGIPMILMIGWRGEPSVSDEPQHLKQGRVQNAMLDAMEIPYYILGPDEANISNFVSKVANKAMEIQSPVAIVVRKDAFDSYSLKEENHSSFSLTREKAIGLILDNIGQNDIVVSTTGKPSREVYEHRASKQEGHQNDFLTVGAMGHSSQIALGIALNSDKNVYCIDGDGAIIMHMGSLSTNGLSKASNFRHIVLNNGAHDSVGGQPTVAFDISIPEIAKANGYNKVFTVSDENELVDSLHEFVKLDGPVLLEVKVMKGARNDLGRPKSTPKENKEKLMALLHTK